MIDPIEAGSMVAADILARRDVTDAVTLKLALAEAYVHGLQDGLRRAVDAIELEAGQIRAED
jgi:hypothetical protein